MQVIKDTWLSRPLPSDHLVLFVYGNDGGVVPRLEGQNLYLEAKESWANLPNKIYDLYKFCVNSYDFEHLFKIDDDVYVASQSLVRYPKNQIDYGGRFFNDPDFRSNPIAYEKHRKHRAKRGLPVYEGKIPAEYAYGQCYLLSYHLAKQIVSLSREGLEDCFLNGGLEDVMVGKVVEQLRVSGLHVEVDNWRSSIWKRYFIAPFCEADLSKEQILARHKISPFRFIISIWNVSRNVLRRFLTYLK